MEKDIGKIKKNEATDVVVRIDDFGGKRGLTIREFVTGERYTGFTKSGTRIPSEAFLAFRELINSIDIADLQAEKAKEEKAGSSLRSEEKAEEKEQKTLEDKGKEAKPKRGRRKKVEEKASEEEGQESLETNEQKVEELEGKKE